LINLAVSLQWCWLFVSFITSKGFYNISCNILSALRSFLFFMTVYRLLLCLHDILILCFILSFSFMLIFLYVYNWKTGFKNKKESTQNSVIYALSILYLINRFHVSFSSSVWKVVSILLFICLFLCFFGVLFSDAHMLWIVRNWTSLSDRPFIRGDV